MNKILPLIDLHENIDKSIELKEEDEYYYKLWEDDRL